MNVRNRPIEIENCDWMDSALAYASGTRSVVASQEIERHLLSCEICRRIINDNIRLVSPAITKEEEQFLNEIEHSVIESAAELLIAQRLPMPPRRQRKAWFVRWWVPATATLALASALILFLIQIRQSDPSMFERGKAAYALSLSQNRPLTYRISESPYVPYLAVRGEAERRQLIAAKVLFEVALTEHPTPEIKHSIGRVLLAEGNASAALAILSHALSEKPGDLEARSDRAVAMAETGNVDGALIEFDAILRENPSQPAALFNRAIINIRLRKPDKVVDDMERLATMEPNSPWTTELINLNKKQ